MIGALAARNNLKVKNARQPVKKLYKVNKKKALNGQGNETTKD